MQVLVCIYSPKIDFSFQSLLRFMGCWLFLFFYISDSVAQKAEPILWLRADHGVTKDSLSAKDGDQIDTWIDHSGKRRNNAMNLEGKGPVFRNNSIDQINFNPVLEFNGSDQGLNFGDDEIFDPPVEEGMYWFMVIKPDITSRYKRYTMVFDYGNHLTDGIGLGYGSHWVFNYLPDRLGLKVYAELITGSEDVVLLRYELKFDDGFNIKLNSYGSPINSAKVQIDELSNDNIAHNATHSVWSGPFSIGRQSMSNNSAYDEGRFFDGDICEMMGFSTLLSDSQIVQIESYLNIKYSVQRNVYTTIFNGKYLDSKGRILWDPMKDTDFNNHIIGIGCDSSFSFIQERSHSIEGNYELQISDEDSNGFDMTNAPIQHVMCGSNGESANDFENAPSGSDARFVQRIKKSWKVINSGFYGVFDLIFTSDAVLPEEHSWYLLVSDNDQFINPEIYGDEVFRKGDSLIVSEISSNQIPDGSTKFLAVAYGNKVIDTMPPEDPDVLSNILWLRSDVGVTTDLTPSIDGQNVTSWIDQSGKRKNDAEHSRLVGPVYRNNDAYFVNYHPVLDFNGDSHSLNFGDDFLFIDSAFKEVNFFVVVKPDDASPLKTGQSIFDFGESVPLGYGLKYGNTKAGMYTGTDFGGQHVSANHIFETQPVVLRFKIQFGESQELFINGAKDPIVESSIQLPELTNQTMSVNEVSIDQSGPFTIGSQSKLFWIDKNGKRYFDGSMLEIIGYKSTMANAEVDH